MTGVVVNDGVLDGVQSAKVIAVHVVLRGGGYAFQQGHIHLICHSHGDYSYAQGFDESHFLGELVRVKGRNAVSDKNQYFWNTRSGSIDLACEYSTG